MNEDETKKPVRSEIHETPFGRLMDRSSMHIDMAACIRNLLVGITLIILALNSSAIPSLDAIQVMIQSITPDD